MSESGEMHVVYGDAGHGASTRTLIRIMFAYIGEAKGARRDPCVPGSCSKSSLTFATLRSDSVSDRRFSP